MRVTNNILEIEHDNATRKYLMSHLNDNVYRNLKNMSVISYDATQKLHKQQLNREKKQELAQGIVEKNDVDN
jgi:hypothetical protein